MANLLDLSQEIVLITGGAGAIGRVIVRVLAEHGAHVVVNDILREADAQAVLTEAGAISPHITYARADANNPDAVAAMFDQLEQSAGLPTVVCCHAGTVGVYPVDQYPLDDYDRVMNLNLRSAFVVAQAATQRWINRNLPGHLIFTSSWVDSFPWPEITPYTASKAGLRALARGFARELAPKNIRANIVAPGIVAVGLAKHQWDTDPEYRARAEKAIPLGHMQPPETVAHAFLYLCSPMASYMTGSVLLVDGGCSLYPMD
jgi:NAD(P)-dependent dehydrogenase (short-subunit alcohol dehydrogenase family)